MDNKTIDIFRRHTIIVAALLVAALACSVNGAYAQEKSYELLPAPDAWFNSTDGVRVGARLRGQQAGTFGDGPHRLNAGLWLGTKIPDHPVSYYLSYTEPISGLSDFGSEANIRLETSYRTGFQQHGLSFNKRWQDGFDEKNYKELSVGIRAEERFDNEYLLYPQLWQSDWLYMASIDYLSTNVNTLGRHRLSVNLDVNTAGNYDQFVRGEASYQQKASLSSAVTLTGRIYTGIASNTTAPQYLFSRSVKSAYQWMDGGLTRARGTIPPSWMRAGNIQITGGPNLRGYLSSDINALNNSAAPLVTSFSALNVQLGYPNPIGKAIDTIPVVGGIMDLNSYLFYDGGTSLGITGFEESRLLSDAGLGFTLSIDIPDYLGKSRGINIRYDLPLWLSHPGNEQPFEFRQVIGIGTVIEL